MPTKPKPRQHNGRDIVEDIVEIRNTGGAAFSKQLSIVNADALAGMKPGQVVATGTRLECIAEEFELVDREDLSSAFKRRLIFQPQRMAFVPDDVVAPLIDEHLVAFKAWEDSQRGQQTLDTKAEQTDAAEQLEAAHLAGDHASGPVKECDLCDWEDELVTAEKNEEQS